MNLKDFNHCNKYILKQVKTKNCKRGQIYATARK